jgi:hypothetical protein
MVTAYLAADPQGGDAGGPVAEAGGQGAASQQMSQAEETSQVRAGTKEK